MVVMLRKMKKMALPWVIIKNMAFHFKMCIFNESLDLMYCGGLSDYYCSNEEYSLLMLLLKLLFFPHHGCHVDHVTWTTFNLWLPFP